MTMSNLIEEAENSLGLNSKQCYTLFGVNKGNWSSMRSAKLTVPDYLQCSIAAHMLLSKRALQTRMQARGISAR